tara:strand:+ start:1457 stop:2722 length:1266 start_codon:yes stop_codon:yes gene_type:complete
MILDIDTEINPWIIQYNTKTDSLYLNKLLLIGYTALNNMNICSDNSYIEDKIDNIDSKNKQQLEMYDKNTQQKISNLNNKIDILSEKISESSELSNTTINRHTEQLFSVIKDITGKVNVPTHKGQIAENYIQNILQTTYPNSIIESTVSESHVADIKFKLKDNPYIIIESKNYSNSVPYKEVTKFKYDLKSNNYKYGIFLSFNQKIQNIHDKIYLENYEDIKILYASGLDFNKSNIIFPVEFMLCLSNSSDQDSKINITQLNQKAEQISLTVKDLENLHSLQQKNSYQIDEQRKIIVKSLDNIQVSLIDNKIQSAKLIKDIKEKISVQVSEFIHNSVLKEPLQFSNLSDKVGDLMIGVHKSIPNHIKMEILENEYVLLNNSKLIAKFIINKNKLKCNILETNCMMTVDKNNISSLVRYLSI